MVCHVPKKEARSFSLTLKKKNQFKTNQTPYFETSRGNKYRENTQRYRYKQELSKKDSNSTGKRSKM